MKKVFMIGLLFLTGCSSVPSISGQELSEKESLVYSVFEDRDEISVTHEGRLPRDSGRINDWFTVRTENGTKLVRVYDDIVDDEYIYTVSDIGDYNEAWPEENIEYVNE